MTFHVWTCDLAWMEFVSGAVVNCKEKKQNLRMKWGATDYTGPAGVNQNCLGETGTKPTGTLRPTDDVRCLLVTS